MNRVIIQLAFLMSSAASLSGQNTGKFELLGNYRALGGQMATTVAPGPVKGSERLYASFLYAENTLDVIAIDPANGKAEVFHSAAPGEYGARNIAVGPEGDVYLGSLPHAHFLRVDRKAHRMIDLGRPSPAEEYIWDVAFGTDKRLYGVTYPGCRLVRYDPATKKSEDLGKMDSTEKYGRWIVGGPDGFMYAAVGTSKANLYVYDTRSGEGREILPADAQIVGTPKPFVGVDGKIYAKLKDRAYQVTGFIAKEIPASTLPVPLNPNTLSDGRILELSEEGGKMAVSNPNTNTKRALQIDYRGEDLQLFRIGFAPDGVLYGSAILPIHFVKVVQGSREVKQIGDLGGGEVYSFLAHGERLLMAAYSGMSPLMSYLPGGKFKPAMDGNPILIEYPGWDYGWRPQAMIEGPDSRVYVGGTAGYGKIEAPLLSWTGESGSVQLHDDIVKDQSVISLTSWGKLIVAGTTTRGGGGSHPTQTDAQLVLWDTETKKIVFRVAPVAGADSLTDLVTAPSGTIYGVAVKGRDNILFVFDPKQRKVLTTRQLPFQSVIYNSVAVGPDRGIWGLAKEGIFRIDDTTHQADLIAKSPVNITGGFDMRGEDVYFISNSKIYRWRRGALALSPQQCWLFQSAPRHRRRSHGCCRTFQIASSSPYVIPAPWRCMVLWCSASRMFERLLQNFQAPSRSRWMKRKAADSCRSKLMISTVMAQRMK